MVITCIGVGLEGIYSWKEVCVLCCTKTRFRISLKLWMNLPVGLSKSDCLYLVVFHLHYNKCKTVIMGY